MRPFPRPRPHAPSSSHEDWEPASVNREIPHSRQSKRPMSLREKGAAPRTAPRIAGAPTGETPPTYRGPLPHLRTYSSSRSMQIDTSFRRWETRSARACGFGQASRRVSLQGAAVVSNPLPPRPLEDSEMKRDREESRPFARVGVRAITSQTRWLTSSQGRWTALATVGGSSLVRSGIWITTISIRRSTSGLRMCVVTARRRRIALSGISGSRARTGETHSGLIRTIGPRRRRRRRPTTPPCGLRPDGSR